VSNVQVGSAVAIAAKRIKLSASRVFLVGQGTEERSHVVETARTIKEHARRTHGEVSVAVLLVVNLNQA